MVDAMGNPTIGERWERGIPHDARSVELYREVAALDFEMGGDFFGFKSGGDGDNGEHLMYLLDVAFARRDAAEAQQHPCHDYLSTACKHALHDKCRVNCKYCEAVCRCGCHE